jgi:hypothetical protein
VLDEEREDAVGRCRIDEVIVVEDERQGVRSHSDIVGGRREERFGRRWLRGQERSEHTPASPWRNRLERRHEVHEESRHVSGFCVQR